MNKNSATKKSKNYRNGHSKKTVKTQLGEVGVKIPLDRNDEYEPQIIEKYNRHVDGIGRKNSRTLPLRNEAAGYIVADKKSV